MNDAKLSARGARIVAALNQFADALETGVPIESKYTMRQVRVVPPPQFYSPEQVRVVRQLIGVSQEVFAQILAVSPMTIRSWEQEARKPSAMARRFLEEIQMSPDHFRGRVTTVAVKPLPHHGTSQAKTGSVSKSAGKGTKKRSKIS